MFSSTLRIADYRVRSIALSFALASALTSAVAQANTDSLSPTEAYEAALGPLHAARAQSDDLTDADRFALQIGIARASRDCLVLSAKQSSFATNAKELLALAQICIFGQQYDAARSVLEKYVTLPQAPEMKQALLLLVRAFLGINLPDSADVHLRTLLRDYPYDPQIHFAIDDVIDNAEGTNTWFTQLAFKLCTTQTANTLPLLVSGKMLEGKDSNVSSSVLFNDAVRCAALGLLTGARSANETLHQLTDIAQQPNWRGTPDLDSMQSALKRQMMVGSRVPLSSIQGNSLTKGALLPRTVPLTHGTVLLIPFALWSPSASDIVRDLARLTPGQHLYAITSWRSNTGRDDVPTNQMIAALESWQQSLPSSVSMLIVPDTDLSLFHADTFPAVVAIQNGIVRANGTISGQGAERILLCALDARLDPTMGALSQSLGGCGKQKQ
jgi:hypothetical protein